MLNALAPDIWSVDHDLFSFGIHFPGRMTVVRLDSGDLWLCSPVPIDDALAAELAALGPVTDIVAPNCFHHVHLKQVVARYPEARLHGAPGLAKKRADLTFTHELQAEAPPAWRGQLDQVLLGALPAFAETVFFHRPSGTLITTDLIMNVHRVKGFLGWLVYWLEGCWKRPAVPRLFHLLNKDKARMNDDLATVARWPIQRLVMAHGDIVEQDAQEAVEGAFAAFGATNVLSSEATS